jgi:N12 class adenine-specific DNA methylase
VKYGSVNAEWTIEADGKITSINNSNAFALRWGSQYKKNGDIIEAALNNKTLKVYRTTVNEYGDEKKVVDKKATLEVRAKVQAIRDEFKLWIWEDETRKAALVE